MKKVILISSLAVICFLTPFVANAQNISDVLSKIARDNAEKYIQPAVNALGANLNSGLYHTADVHGILGFDVGLKAMAVFVPDDQLKFTAVLPDSIQLVAGGPKVATGYPRTYETATVWGKQGIDSARSTTGSVPAFPFPGGVDLKFMLLLVPQASLGLPMGTEVMLRYIPAVEINSSVGKLSFFGVGIRHDIDQYIPIPAFPIDIAAQFVYQNLSLKKSEGGNLFDATAISLGLQGSKTLVILTLYGGLAYEQAKITIGPYQYTEPFTGAKINVSDFELEANNKVRFTLGAAVNLALIKVNVDYSITSTPVLSAGLSVGLR